MEAGIEPALPQKSLSNLYTILIDLSDLCMKLCNISYYSDSCTEQKLIIHLLTSALSQSRSITLCSTLGSIYKGNNKTRTEYNLYMENTTITNNIKTRQQQLWKNLSYPGLPPLIRKLLFEFLQQLDSTLESISSYNKNYLPCPIKLRASPSILQQVVFEPTHIIDHYKISLTKNYYHPISPFDMYDAMDEQNDIVNQTQETDTPNPPLEDIEQSIDTIADMLNESEDDDFPV